VFRTFCASVGDWVALTSGIQALIALHSYFLSRVEVPLFRAFCDAWSEQLVVLDTLLDAHVDFALSKHLGVIKIRDGGIGQNTIFVHCVIVIVIVVF